MKLFIKTFAGLEEVLAAELEALGAENINIRKRAVYVDANQELMYRCNLELRTAIRILKDLDQFRVRNEDDLYEQVQKIDWSQYLTSTGTLAIDAVSFFDRMDHNHYLALKTKDAIVDQFRDKTGERPSVDTDRPDIRLHVHIDGTGLCTLSLDSSGDGLHRRGYRYDTGHAPLNEVLAAGLIALSGWTGDTAFVDPMCGSGTILIEAATLAMRQPPNWYRKKFGFHSWPDFDEALWEKVRHEAEQKIRPLFVPIVGGDRFGKVLETAKINLERAHISKVEIRKIPFQQFMPPAEAGTLITNPPYDLRMKMDDIEGLYEELGDAFKKNFAGYTAWVFSGNKDAMKRVGLRPSRKLTLYNGPIECKFHRFDLYKGSRKRKRIKRSDLEE